jgi:transcriptional regulator with XRE-family HTH domain
METPGVTLKTARERAGLSQRKLATLAGMPQSTVGRIETDLVRPTIENWQKLLALCGWTVDAEPMGMVGGRPSSSSEPTFLWDTDMTLGRFKQALKSRKTNVRSWAFSRLLQEATWREIWALVTPQEVVRNLPITRFRSKPKWEQLVERFPSA